VVLVLPEHSLIHHHHLLHKFQIVHIFGSKMDDVKKLRHHLHRQHHNLHIQNLHHHQQTIGTHLFQDLMHQHL
jgi:hypothetical protein